MEVNFRKIDIDQYDEDVLLDSEIYEPELRDPAQVLDDTKQKAATVRGYLSKYAHLLLSSCLMLTQFTDMSEGIFLALSI